MQSWSARGDISLCSWWCGAKGSKTQSKTSLDTTTYIVMQKVINADIVLLYDRVREVLSQNTQVLVILKYELKLGNFEHFLAKKRNSVPPSQKQPKALNYVVYSICSATLCATSIRSCTLCFSKVLPEMLGRKQNVVLLLDVWIRDLSITPYIYIEILFTHTLFYFPTVVLFSHGVFCKCSVVVRTHTSTCSVFLYYFLRLKFTLGHQAALFLSFYATEPDSTKSSNAVTRF